jgi:Ni/Co efflux regulator RcnB
MRLLSIAFALMVLTGPAAAQTAGDIADTVFKEAEKRVIEDFFGKKADPAEKKQGKKAKKGKKGKKAKKGKQGKGLPPGLAGKESLPPGLAKQLEKNGTLPPGLAKRGLPADLASKLPPPPADSERVIVDNDVVLIEKATGKIFDIIKDAIK